MSVLTIQTFQPQISWQYGGSTATLRIKYSANFTDSAGNSVLRGLYKDVPCTIALGILTVPQFDLITTNDALVNPLVTCSAQFIDSGGAARDWLFQNFSIPQALTPSASIGSLVTYNQGSALVLPPDFYLDRDEVTALVTTMLAALGFGPATNLALGIVRLSAAAGDPADPVVWEQGDPNARDAQKLKGIDLDATVGSPADTNVVGFNAVSGKYIAQATAIPSLHGPSHENNGGDEINVAGLSGLLADPQMPLAHAVLHELGGTDEINVAGLSGVLADPQTPAAHAATHISGGIDPFTSTQLLEAIVKRIQTSTGPTNLLVGAIADGEFLKRDGTDIVGGVPSGSGAPSDATYIVQTTNGGLSAEQALGALATGILKSTTGTGVVSIAVAGADYVSPTGATVDETGSPLTLDSSHNGKIVLVDADVTVPSGLGAGFNVMLIQIGAGPVTITASETTVNNRQSHTDIAGGFGAVTLYAYAADTFLLAGDTA